MSALRPGTLRALRSVVGDEHVLDDPDVVAGHVVDWTGRFHGTTPAVVRPASTDEVAGIVRACAASTTSDRSTSSPAR